MAHLAIDVLGTLRISVDDRPITTMESAKVRALLAYLAVEADRPHRRETLVGLLWPEYPEDSARHSLRQALFSLRSTLGDQAAKPPYLLVARETIQFNRESDYSLDLDRFNLLFSSYENELSQDGADHPVLASHLEEMARLYQGEFLQHFSLEDCAEYEGWLLARRESSHQRILRAHSYLTNYYEMRGDFQVAQRHAARQLELDPWREEAYRQLMRVLALIGERNAALSQYDTCRRVLAEELDVEPSAETRELYELIKQGAIKPQAMEPGPASPPPARNLPIQLTPFIGRETELRQLGDLIRNPECRCISLVGPGGIGKTRLAVQAAEDCYSEFAQGAVFVPLASVGSIGGVIPAMTKAIDVNFYGPGEPTTQLLNYLYDKQMLLLLDNIEHLSFEDPLQENISHLLIEILQCAPGIKLLVTSREALRLQGEWLFEVPGLHYPEAAQKVVKDHYDAITLFVQRTRRILPGYSVNDDDLAEIAHICRLVEGMPLAIELAATWMRTLSPAEISMEIQENLDFLSASLQDMPERHRSMKAVFENSWRMLSANEQQVLSKLSVFRGGFQRQAAEQVASASLTILSLLVNRTLLRRTTAGRYDLHELVRQYCAGQLATNPEEKASTQERHFNYYLTLAETANQELQGGDQLTWLSRLEREHDNLRNALEWALEQAGVNGGGERTLRLAAALRWFWRMRGYFHEGRDWLQEALQRSPEEQTEARSLALAGLSLII
ncbi:MAG: AfsR/SARP family transcriptional regulator, partial [Acidobacteriaceae bacterium]